LIAFGLGLASQLWAIAHRQPIVISDRRVLLTLALDLLYLAVILWIGHLRGWSIASFGVRFSWKGTGGGILLFVAAATLKILVDVLLTRIHLPQPVVTVAGLTLPVIILLSVINPVFEEVLEAGYFIHSLQRFGMWPAVLASSAFRGLLHMYQGFDGVAALSAQGLLFALAYWRWRQLWPLVLAHSLDDFLGLLYVTEVASI
jgi:membrane protease YdiL (CAAX protease family)